MTDDLPDLIDRLKVHAEYVCGEGFQIRSVTSALLTEAASLIQRLEGERDEWKADAKHYISRCGEQQEALETAEQALSASQKEVERLKAVALSAREGLSIAAGWARSKPDSDRARDKISRGLAGIRSALQTGGKEHG